MRKKLYGIAAGMVALGVLAGGLVFATHPAQKAQADAGGMPRFQHVFYIMMENHAYSQIIGNTTDAPHINALAHDYTLATAYYGVTHPSEPNYVASVGGSYFGIQDDNSYYCTAQNNSASGCGGTVVNHQINAKNIGSQLEDAGLSWKTYQQSLPYTGYTGANYPAGAVPGATAKLYASKHNPFLNFLAYYGPEANSPTFTPTPAQQAELNKMVPDTQLATDLANGTIPNFSYIVPDQCHDMHGTTGCTSDPALIAAGDQYVNDTVNMIMSSTMWKQGNNAIVITWDENDYSETDCPSNPAVAAAGCQVPTIVIANHGPRGLQYSVPANHYSLLLTIQQAFGLGCLVDSCPASGSNVRPMTPMFRN